MYSSVLHSGQSCIFVCVTAISSSSTTVDVEEIFCILSGQHLYTSKLALICVHSCNNWNWLRYQWSIQDAFSSCYPICFYFIFWLSQKRIFHKLEKKTPTPPKLNFPILPNQTKLLTTNTDILQAIADLQKS